MRFQALFPIAAAICFVLFASHYGVQYGYFILGCFLLYIEWRISDKEE